MTDWIAPKMNWTSTDIYNVEDYNRIAGNIAYVTNLASLKYGFSDDLKVNRLDNGGSPTAYYQFDVKPISYTFTPLTYASDYNLYNDYNALRNLLKLLILTESTLVYSSGVYCIYYKNGEYGYYTGYVAGMTNYSNQYLWSSVMDDVRSPVDLRRVTSNKNTGFYFATYPNYELENTPFWSAYELNTIEGNTALVKYRLDNMNS